MTCTNDGSIKGLLFLCMNNNGVIKTAILVKIVVIFFTVMMFFVNSFAQQPATSPDLQTQMDWVRKSNKQQRTAWTLLGAGSVLLLSGIVVKSKETSNGGPYPPPGDPNPKSFGPPLIYTGLGFMAGSIPLFVAAGENRRKAMAAVVSLKIEKTPMVKPSLVLSGGYPAVAVQIRM